LPSTIPMAVSAGIGLEVGSRGFPQCWVVLCGVQVQGLDLILYPIQSEKLPSIHDELLGVEEGKECGKQLLLFSSMHCWSIENC
jgi:hypothetical protein